VCRHLVNPKANHLQPALDTCLACPYASRMEVQLTPDQRAFVRQAIESGRLRREEDAVKEALSSWEERERRRQEILVAVDRGEASLPRGEGRRVTTPEQAKQLAAEIQRRGLARLNGEQNSSS
jgi:putative addiction module CopG family antidote